VNAKGGEWGLKGQSHVGGGQEVQLGIDQDSAVVPDTRLHTTDLRQSSSASSLPSVR
jgi:hypothetical protein